VERKRGSLTQAAFNTDGSAVRFHNGLADGQAQADPGDGGPADVAGAEELGENL
jgi:hypothetical protein